ncbi:DUF6308 family protein, partial [Rothia kristinae]|uniref:DUF6308 family protein n=1 Tax=Rothia kristinae TaxID=37923 RepID=UPI001C92C74C
ITPADLHAISLMSVTIEPRSTRRLLSGPERKEVLHELKQLPDVDLLVADDAALEAMYRLHLVVKRVLGDPNAKSSNRWVSASKLCARKRRDLFPVRDREVCTLLGLLRLADARVDWVVFQALIQDTGVQRAIAALPKAAQKAARGRELVLDSSHLRLLDAALWTYAKKRVPEAAAAEE